MDDLFVGRQQELRLLERAFEDARAGRGQLVLIAGEPGIGKSRLADEFAGRAVHAGAHVAWGRCWELGGAPAYWPWTEALRGAIPLVAGTAGAGPPLGLTQLLPELASDEDGTRAATEDPDVARFRLFEAVVDVLRACSGQAPLVVVLEDMHAADEPSLLLLEYVVRRVSTMPVLLLGTYRDVELSVDHRFTGVLAELLRERATARTVLVGLQEAEVAALIEGATGVPPTAETASRVHDHTEGNPLYVREVARLLASERKAADDDRLPIPHDVRETVLRRVQRLPDDCNEAIAFAAVIGREFPIDLLTALAGSDVVERLEPALRAGLLQGGAPGTGRLRFAHAVVSEALYEVLPPARRLEAHRRIAEAMERLYAADTEPHLASLARHHLAALPVTGPDKAVEAARRAAEHAVTRLAYEEGVRLYRMAVAAAAGMPDRSLGVELLLGMGEAQACAGDTTGSKATFLQAAEVARRLGLPRHLARAALGYGGRFVWMRAADDVHLVPLLREALESVPEEDNVLRIHLLARLAGALRDEPSRTAREQLSAEAVEMAKRVGDPGVLTYALAARFTAIWGPDTVDEMRRLAAETVAAAERSGQPERTGYALWLAFLSDLVVGQAEASRVQQARYQGLGEELRQPSLRWYAAVQRSITLLMEGRLAQAEEAIEEGLRLGRRAQAWDAEASYRLGLSILRWEQARLGEMEEAFEDALVVFPGYRFFRCMLALLYLETGRTEQATALTEKLLAGGEETLPYNNDWLAAMTILAEIISRAEIRDLAGPVYDALVPYAGLIGSGGGEAVTGSVHRPLGLLAGLLGRADDAERHLEQAMEIHTRMGAELWLAHAELDLAVQLLRRHESQARARAAHLLDRTMHRAQTLGLTALAQRVDGVRATAAPDTGARLGGLTPREMQVAALLAEGASNRAIADSLVISERTAETHVQNILTKLGFTTRAQVAAWAVMHGMGVGT